GRAAVVPTYTCYGLRLLADGEIPGLPAGDATHPPDVRVFLNRIPTWVRRTSRTLWYESHGRNSRGRSNLQIWRLPDGMSQFVYDNQTEFVVDPLAARVWCAWPERGTVDDAAVLLRGAILGFLLRVRGILCLHASVLAIGDRAIALVGDAGSGKSTTAAAFVQLGYPLVSDDIAARGPIRDQTQ